MVGRLLPALGRSLKQGLAALLAPAEDPRQTFVPAHLRQRELLAKVGAARRSLDTSRARLRAHASALEDTAATLQAQASQMVAAGNEAPARRLVERRLDTLAALQALRAELDTIDQEEARLTLVERRLAAQIDALHVRQELASARLHAAEAEVRLGEALTDLSGDLAALDRFVQDAETQAEQMQARAEALHLLRDLGPHSLRQTQDRL